MVLTKFQIGLIVLAVAVIAAVLLGFIWPTWYTVGNKEDEEAVGKNIATGNLRKECYESTSTDKTEAAKKCPNSLLSAGCTTIAPAVNKANNNCLTYYGNGNNGNFALVEDISNHTAIEKTKTCECGEKTKYAIEYKCNEKPFDYSCIGGCTLVQEELSYVHPYKIHNVKKDGKWKCY